MTLTYIKKCRKVAGMLIISIPKEVLELGDIIEGDALEIKIKRLTKRDKIKPKEKTKEKYTIPDVLRDAVKKALTIVYDETYTEQYDKREAEEIRNSTEKSRYIPGSLELTISDFWVSYSKIVGTITYNKLCDITQIKTSNIYKDVGVILGEFGFIEIKRNPSGTHRLIRIKTIEELINTKG